MTARRTLTLVFLGLSLTLLIAGAVAALRLRPGPFGRSGAVLTVTVGDDLPEEAPASWIGRFVSGDRRTFGDLVGLFERAARDDRVQAIVARIAPSDLGWARLQELHDAMRAFGDSGKILACHAEVLDSPAYFLASACDTIDLPPTGVFSVPGVALQVEFYKGALGKLGIEAEMEHVGAYKSASEPLTRQDLSVPAREQLEAMLDAVYASLVEAVADARDIAPETVRRLLDGGLLAPDQALEAGLVDDLRYYDEVLDDVKDQVGPRAEEVEDTSYLREVRAHRRAGRDRIAVIYASGMIVSGASEESGLLGRVLGSETLIESLQRARDNPAVKAVVLRVDSPGGSGPASDAIWRETQRVREKKPLVVSMGDVAASGGYWIAAGADAIVAEPLSLTGSIGVVGGKFYLKPFYDWIGVSKEILKRGRNADLYTDYNRFSDEQRRMVRASMIALYREFLARASEGRRKSQEEIDRVAQGRVWTGGQALERGLVDELGGLASALDRARALAKIPAGRSVGIDLYPRPKGLLESLAGLQGALTRAARGPDPASEARLAQRLLGERVLALMPFRVTLR